MWPEFSVNHVFCPEPEPDWKKLYLEGVPGCWEVEVPL